MPFRLKQPARLAIGGLVAALALPAAPARAGSTTIGFTVTTERVPDDFNESKSTDWQASLSHAFDNGLILGGSVKYYDTSHSDAWKTNVEGTAGTAFDLVKGLSLRVSGGVGEHLQNADNPSFPYYVFYAALDVTLTPVVTWNAVMARYRNAFDTENDYNTPELATGFSFKIDDNNTVTVRVERDWSDGEVSYNAIELGYKYRF
ncbi:hypothetical protein [Ancylobacter terrae]|uniref:hypothetical protein n=1 Tax=Ancylobacter sp. sgz301288 TaxID=3342077 RepID=UPI00385F22F8